MFTVIFLSRAAKRIFDESKTFFDPFCEADEIAFCEWNESPTARGLTEALPQLTDIIQGRAQWRAVVVDHADGDAARHPENPFDFLDNTETVLNLEESPYPLVRIAHHLLGYPPMTARDFEPVVTYRGENGGRVVGSQPGDDVKEALSRLGRTESDVRIEFRQVPYTPEEQARHAALTERYRMKEVPPTEVVFVSTRSRLGVDAAAQLRAAWRTEDEQHTSRFVERNDYPAASRFAVYDLLNPENSGYEQDKLRFWIAVLAMSVNTIPPSAFQADRVYRLGVEFSDAALGELLNAHMSRLTALREHVDTILRRPERPPEIDVRDVFGDERVPVRFEGIGGAELSVRTTGFGLATDVPRSESSAWFAEYDELQSNAMQFVRRPRRVLARAVFDARAKSRGFLDQQLVLSDIEREEIEDELTERVRALTEPATTDILDRDKLARLLEEQNRTASRHIAQRMRLWTIAASSAIVLLVWLGAFTPYLIQAADKGADAMAWSVFVVACVVLVLAGLGLAMLLWMRHRLVSIMRGVNATLREFVARVNNGAIVFGEYLSKLATYMRARALLIGSQRLRVQEDARARRLRALRAEADRVIDVERRVVKSLGQPVNVRRLTTGFANFDIDEPRQVAAFFQFDVGERRARFNESGETVRAPYDFVTRLTLERLRMFEQRGDGPVETVGSTGATV